MIFLFETIHLGLTNLRLHLLRSFLTALGIILGVSAVIAMVSLGEGSKRQALLQIEQLGAKNIILRSQRPAESQSSQKKTSNNWISRYGLRRDDLEVIQTNFPDAEAIVPLKEVGSKMSRAELSRTSQAFGTTPEFFDVAKLRLARGRYLTTPDLTAQSMVCVIGSEVARELFKFDDPLGDTIRIDAKAFTVVGVLAPVGLAGGAGSALVGRDLNLDVHIPITTARSVMGDMVFRGSGGSFSNSQVEVSEIYVASPDRERVLPDSKRLKRIIDSRHTDSVDVSMIVPYELLENAKKSQLTWNLVLGFIAGISLLVGGIGIMNIMLATVTERTREIGIRRALGATRKAILYQFLVETSVLSTGGGLLGVALGIGGSWFIQWIAPRLPHMPVVGQYFSRSVSLPTYVTLGSVVLAFSVAVAVGLIFGIYPARRAAAQDPIVALRHD
ncbi:MAG: ABC transporter permease [Phycisphaeraceae bacterium]|nr:ABC transporter permease [Phycisphaeraceae bacterium]